jgi:hypothetical protein
MSLFKGLNYSFGRSPVPHDSDTGFSNDIRLNSFLKLNSYVDRSTVCIIPTRGAIDARVVNSWFRLISPVNQKFIRLFISGGEVADAYNTAIIGILHHPHLSKYKYILSMEDDNIPPPDGLLKLVETMVAAEKKNENLWAVSGLYWSKGFELGVPIAFGDTRKPQFNLDAIDLNETGVTRCCLMPQGFTLYRMDLFRKISYPWFKTVEDYDPDAPVFDQIKTSTQDHYFFERCYNEGLGIGVRADVKVGHLDIETGQVW